jgi:hypothetical protein
MGTPTEFFRWWVLDERTGKRRLTRYAMTRADAARQFPGAEPDLSSREVRLLPEPGEVHANSKPPIEARAVSEPRLSACAFCGGSGWLCADHPALPWKHDDCGSEGVPCVCNPTGAVCWERVYAETPSDNPSQ